MIWHDVDQNSEEWLALRMGKFTASTFAEIMADKKTAAYDKAICRVVYERLTGESPEFYESEYMKRGHDIEALAREEYESTRFEEVTNGGFFEYDEFTGASPDGLIGSDGLIEIKSPAFNTMISYLRSRTLPSQYKWQVQGQLFVTGRSWCDFMAYHPKLPVFIIRAYPDKAMFSQLMIELELATYRVKSIINDIRQ